MARPRTSDAEYRALVGLAALARGGEAERPIDALEQVAHMARELTRASYAALAVTNEDDYVEGFVASGLAPDEDRRLKAPPQGHGPLGTMRQDGLTVRIEDLDRHAKAFGFPPKHPEMKRLLGVPIWNGPELRGALYVTDRTDGRPFDDDDEVTLRTLARHAAAVIATRWY